MSRNLNRGFRFLLTGMLALTLAFLVLYTAPAKSAELGAMLTPKNFPRHTPDDVHEMFKLGTRIGNHVVLNFDWKDENHSNVARIMMTLSDQYGLTPIMALNPLKANGIKAVIDPPESVRRSADGNLSFANPAVHRPYIKAVLELAKLRPPYLALATDVNLLAMSDIKEYVTFAAIYKRVYQEVKKVSPKTKVFVTFQWDILHTMGAREPNKIGDHVKLVELFRPNLDAVGFSSTPATFLNNPAEIPADYYQRIKAFVTRSDTVLFTKLGWPSAGKGSEGSQVNFIQRLPGLMASINPKVMSWALLHDLDFLPREIPFASIGLLDAKGREKPSFREFSSLAGGSRPAMAASGAAAPAAAKNNPGDFFGIYVATLDGRNVRRVLGSVDQQMTHARISPDHQWITFTRYNRKGRNGRMQEESGYLETEIMVVNADGSGLVSVVPPKKGVIASNSSWTPDGKGLIYLSTDNDRRRPEIRVVDWRTGASRKLATPGHLLPSDPHMNDKQVVFAAKGKKVDVIWLMKADGSNARQLTNYDFGNLRSDGAFNLGDFDPKISPDNSKVAVMRSFGGINWHVVVVDIATGKERDLTKPGATDGLPEWSSDSRLLIFWHANPKNLKSTGVYTVQPDGGGRRIIPLPRGVQHSHPSFFPGDGSSKKTRIIFSAMKNPKL